MTQNYQARRKNSAAFMIAFGTGSLALTLAQLVGWVKFDFTGRWAWLYTLIANNFGPNGPPVFSGLIGLILLVIGISGYTTNRGD